MWLWMIIIPDTQKLLISRTQILLQWSTSLNQCLSVMVCPKSWFPITACSMARLSLLILPETMGSPMQRAAPSTLEPMELLNVLYRRSKGYSGKEMYKALLTYCATPLEIGYSPAEPVWLMHPQYNPGTPQVSTAQAFWYGWPTREGRLPWPHQGQLQLPPPCHVPAAIVPWNSRLDATRGAAWHSRTSCGNSQPCATSSWSCSPPLQSQDYQDPILDWDNLDTGLYHGHPTHIAPAHGKLSQSDSH